MIHFWALTTFQQLSAIITNKTIILIDSLLLYSDICWSCKLRWKSDWSIDLSAGSRTRWYCIKFIIIMLTFFNRTYFIIFAKSSFFITTSLTLCLGYSYNVIVCFNCTSFFCFYFFEITFREIPIENMTAAKASIVIWNKLEYHYLVKYHTTW